MKRILIVERIEMLREGNSYYVPKAQLRQAIDCITSGGEQ